MPQNLECSLGALLVLTCAFPFDKRNRRHGYIPHPNAHTKRRTKFKPSRVSHCGR
jgi:hypothetical protein